MLCFVLICDLFVYKQTGAYADAATLNAGWTVQRPQQMILIRTCWNTPRVLVHLTYILGLAYFTSASVCTCHTYTVLLHWRPCGIIGLFLAIRFQAIITFATVGFGDYSPTTRLGRVLGAWWWFLGSSHLVPLCLSLNASRSIEVNTFRGRWHEEHDNLIQFTVWRNIWDLTMDNGILIQSPKISEDARRVQRV